MSTRSESPSTAAAATAPALERWLRSPWRRPLLILLGVLVLSGTSTLLWADAMAAVERDIDLGRTFARRLIEWGLWGLAFEPLVWLSGVMARTIRPAVLLLIPHALLSVGTAFGLQAADLYLAEAWIGDQSRSGFSPRGSWRRSGGGGGGERPPREERGGPPSDGQARSEQRPEPTQAERDTRAAARRTFQQAWQRIGRDRRAESDIVIYWLIIGLGLAGRSFLRHREQERRSGELELQAARLETELHGAKLSQLEAQLQPHFLFNALHSVGGLVRDGQRDEALSTLAALGDLLRMTLQHGSLSEVSLADELDLVEAYLDVERIRLGERLEVSIETEPGTGKARVPALLLLPLVENAIKHAIAPRAQVGHLILRATHEGDTVVIEVEDDGPGFPEAVLAGVPASQTGGGIGLSNSRSRAEALLGPGAFVLENPAGGGARVTLRVPAPEGPHHA